MKLFPPLTFAAILLVSACAGSQLEKEDIQTPVATLSMSPVHSYQCDSGETITATYPSSESATIQYQGSDHAMQIAISGSGARYVGGELEWWTKGSGPGSNGTLFHHMPDGTSGEMIELCTES
jgi:membrane-bound inhibitor of C-type lysozyme